MVVKSRKASSQEDKDLTEGDVSIALRGLGPIWNELFPAEQTRIVQLLIEKILVSQDNVDIRIRTDGLSSLIKEMSVMPRRKVA
jgi:hypothetical protein